MVEGDRQPGRLAHKWIDNILMWCGQDIKGAMTITEDINGEHSWLASVVLADHGITGEGGGAGLMD